VFLLAWLNVFCSFKQINDDDDDDYDDDDDDSKGEGHEKEARACHQ